MNGLEAFAGAQAAGPQALRFGEVAAEAAQALNGTVAAPLLHLGHIEARGTDVEAFLQGQLSNDVRKLTVERGQLSAFNSPKGRLLAVLHLVRTPASLLLELPREILEPTLKRLRMFVMRSKVTLAAAEHHVLLGVAGADAAMVLAESGLAVPTTPLGCAWTGETCVMRRLGTRPRYTVVIAAPEAGALWAQLTARALPVGTAAWQLLDIEAGVPTVHAATQDRFVAQMCNLDTLGGISFDKGCYTGQEVIARVHYRGAVKRHMIQQRLLDTLPAPGDKLEAGEVVAAAPHPDGGALALVVAGTQA